MFKRCREELERRNLPFVVINGSRAQRFAAAVTAINETFPEISRG